VAVLTTTDAEPTPATDRGPRRRLRRFSRRDRITIMVMLGIPLLINLLLIWLPTFAAIALSFTRWNGIGGLENIDPIGAENYKNIVTIYPPFWPAIRHNLYWLGFFLLVATPLGLLIAYLLDKNLRGSRVYQNLFFLPVVLSLALVGIIWQLVYSPEDGLLNNILGRTDPSKVIDWFGDPKINIWAALVAASWRHVGYIMVLYLAGLKSVDPVLREAAALDGANEWQTFRHVVFPSLRPINIVILVVTVIESLRAFDIAYVINRGTNGLELLSTAVTNNIIGEASRVGFGSAIAVILLALSLIPIVSFLISAFRREAR
jgi:multiple sugar transport system permease protein